MKEKSEHIEIIRKIRDYFGKVKFSVYVDEENKLIHIQYTDFKPVCVVDEEIGVILHTEYNITIQRNYSDKVIEAVLIDMYHTYTVFGIDSKSTLRAMSSLSAMVAFRLADETL